MATYDVVVHTVESRPIAAVRDRMTAGEVAARCQPALDTVWKFLSGRPGLRTDGHNIFLYHHDMDDASAMTVDFGVQVIAEFEGDGNVRCVTTPGGDVASTIHVGPYHNLTKAHDAVQKWVAASGRRVGACSWEIYGDWCDDSEKLETHVLYLLA